MSQYVAVLHHDADSGAWGIMFPDFPGCISAGDSFAEALRCGTEALATHAALMRSDGDPIPEPRTLEAIRAEVDWVEWDGAHIAMVPMLPPAGKERINVTFDRHLLAQIDLVSKNRSAFLEEAARRMLE